MLCHSCDQIVLEVDGSTPDVTIRRYKNLQELRDSAPTCDFCDILYETARELESEDVGAYCKQSWGPEFFALLLTRSPIVVQHRTSMKEHNIYLSCYLVSENAPEYSGGPPGFDFRDQLDGIFVEPDSNAANTVAGRPLSGTSTKDEIIHLARTKLIECREGHEHCSPSKSNLTFMPKRVLDLDPLRRGEQRIDLFLNPGNHFESYSTLSYCWGNDLNLQLTTQTQSAFTTNGIRCSELPKTIKEACELSLGIGIRYLWVDSLCIIQDIESDWRAHSSLMGTIYNNSEVTISAAASESCTAGLFHGRHYRATSVARLKSRSSSTDVEPCWIRRKPPPWGLEEPAESRGWTQQETLLSRRLLTLGTHELSWQCRTLNWNQSGKVLVPSSYMQEIFPCPPLHYPMRVYGGVFNERYKTNVLSHVWHELTQNYARRNLTLPKDKLVAISGIAKWLFARKPIGEKYLAGLWRSDLPGDLLWYNDLVTPADLEQSTRPSVYRAPTWSWASLDCQYLHWLDIDSQVREAQVVDCKLLYKCTDPFGEVEAGYLDLDAPVKIGWLVPSMAYPENYCLWDNNYECPLDDPTPGLNTRALGAVFMDMYTQSDIDDAKSKRPMERVRECECIIISTMAGLIVEKSDSDESDAIVPERRRAGIFRLYDESKQSWWSGSSRRLTRLS